VKAPEHFASEPPRLVYQAGALRELLHAAESEYRFGLDEGSAFDSLQFRAHRGTTSRLAVPAFVFALLCAAAVAIIALRPSTEGTPRIAETEAATTTPSVHSTKSNKLTERKLTSNFVEQRGVQLPVGQTTLADGTRVELAQASRANVHASDRGARVVPAPAFE